MDSGVRVSSLPGAARTPPRLARKTCSITRGVDVPVFGSGQLKQVKLQLPFSFLPTYSRKRMEFPPNSKKSQSEVREAPKRVERVTSGDVTRRRRGLGKQFKSTFFGGDARGAIEYVIFQVIIPAAKDTLADAGATAIERMIFGDSRSRRRGPSSGAMGHIDYRGMSSRTMRDDRPPMGAPTTRITRQQRARHNFDDIVLSSRSDAEEVLDRLYDVVNRYEAVTVADLYELVGIESRHTDHKWGWTELHGASVERLRNGGYLLDLPEPEALD